uniref:Uncharacterized protein n=1 Tax=Rhizophora mucronata TaxID=61149 RepID=A0A2P2PRU1_RHIMU
MFLGSTFICTSKLCRTWIVPFSINSFSKVVQEGKLCSYMYHNLW